MQIQKPVSPITLVRNSAGKIRKIHMLERFMILGIRVSPAPTQTP